MEEKDEVTSAINDALAVEPETIPEEEVNPLQEKLDKEVEARRQLTARTLKAEADRKKLEVELNKIQKGEKVALDVEDYIDISASLEGLDQREKEYLAKEHKLTGKSLSEIRKDEDFELWQTAYRAKVEKENLAIRPSGTQGESERPKSLIDKLATASIDEKEAILREAGLYKENRPRADRVDIGIRR